MNYLKGYSDIYMSWYVNDSYVTKVLELADTVGRLQPSISCLLEMLVLATDRLRLLL